ncbi:MAG TPA: hypothetical protein VM534_08100, partial [Thermoanaerobaculia bacterium]|nr:hypothetical protein [Thermoanaerobaculia bacterium]
MPTIEIVEWGGRIGDRFMAASGAPVYTVGEEVLVFLRPNRRGEWTTFDFSLGRYEFAHDRFGERVALRSGDFGGWDWEGNPFVDRPRRAEPFLQFIRDVVAGQTFTGSYFVDGEVRGMRNGVRRPAGAAAAAIVPHVFDLDLDTSTSVGAAAWTDDGGSSINYSKGAAATGDVADCFN